MDLWILFPLCLQTDPPLPPCDGIKHIDSKTGENINIVKYCEKEWAKGNIPSSPGGFAYEIPFHTDTGIKGKVTIPCHLVRYKYKHHVPFSFIGLCDEDKGSMFTDSVHLNNMSLHDIMRNWDKVDIDTTMPNAIHLWGKGVITGTVSGNQFTAVISDCALCVNLVTNNIVNVKSRTQ